MILVYIVMIVLFIVVIVAYRTLDKKIDEKVKSLNQDNQNLKGEIEYLNEKIKDNPEEIEAKILANGIQTNGQKIVDLNVGISKLYSRIEELED